jgi:predicted GIY-YIG superfamily endonuclease
MPRKLTGKFYVYKLVNKFNEIEYIGETKDLRGRYHMHITSSKSRFQNRTDLDIEIMCELDNKTEARDMQYELQKQYGFETDRERYTKICIDNAKKRSQPLSVYDYDTNEKLFDCSSITQTGVKLGLNSGVIFKRIKHKDTYIWSDLLQKKCVIKK